MTNQWRPFDRHRAQTRWVLTCVLAAAGIAGCSTLPPGSSNGPAGDRILQQAQAALARWAAAIGQAKAPGIVFVGDLTSQIGEWEAPVGDNNKIALMSGHVQPTASLPAEAPLTGTIRWSDGTTMTTALLSAAQALDAIVASAASSCGDCRPLEITAARLASGSVETSRGPATAPLWEFDIRGTSVRVSRVAIANSISVVPPAWDPNNAPEGISIESASGAPDDRQLTVTFIGAPQHGDQPCGADYAAEAVESQLAVVVIVIEHPNPTPGGCDAVGAERTATVSLLSPLGDRTVLEVKEGLPVPVLAP